MSKFKKRFFCSILLVSFAASIQKVSAKNTDKTAEWEQVNIGQTDLTNQNVFLQTVGGRLSARCDQNGIDLIPNFSDRNSSDLCRMRSTIAPGSYGKILKIYKRVGSDSEYAIQWKLTDVPEIKKQIRGRAREGDTQWVYYNPKTVPYVQLYIDNKGWVDDRIDDYLNKASKGEVFHISGLDDEKADTAISAEENSEALNKDGDGNKEEKVRLKQQGVDVVTSEAEVRNSTNDQDASFRPGQLLEFLPAIFRTKKPAKNKVLQPPAEEGYCNLPELNEKDGNTQYEKFCSASTAPSQRVKRRWRRCQEPALIDIDRHARSATVDYADWLRNEVETAARETKISTKNGDKIDASSNCADPSLMMAIMAQESTFHPLATNGGGDYGIAQFQPSTAQSTQKYINKFTNSSSSMKNLIRKSLTWVPPGCEKTVKPWKKSLTTKCFQAIQKHCEQGGKLVASLFCPQYAIRLQAFHFKQICESNDKVSQALMGKVKEGDDIDSVAQIRYLISRYNRGNRIYNSAAFYKANFGEYPSAREYGVLWEARRHASFRRGKNKLSTRHRGDGLAGQTINRCYNWRIAGLCGGLKGTMFDLYSKQMCKSRKANPQSPELIADSDRKSSDNK
jgi:hypothetical protein